MTVSSLVCVGCGASPGPDEPYPFGCPNSRNVDDLEHTLVRVLDTSRAELISDGESPFARHRRMLHVYHAARASGLSDADFLAVQSDLEQRIIAGGFGVTPFERVTPLEQATGTREVWVKDETANVAGSHKARHLMAIALHLDLLDATGRGDPDRELAIASCGNAALAAAVIARAARRVLRVFVPDAAEPKVVHRIRDLGARVTVCGRSMDRPGDPAYVRLLEALAAGALPFTCQGNLNALAIDGGATIGYEIAASGIAFDHLVVQVGGGALAAACIQGFAETRTSARVHTVQTTGAHPLERAYHLARAGDGDVDRAMAAAAAHRSAFMWPWEEPHQSAATGILDDETYDWWAVVRGMLASGGQPVVVDDARLDTAVQMVRAAGRRADATGAAGLAGLLMLREAGVIGEHDRVAVLLTGAVHANATPMG